MTVSERDELIAYSPINATWLPLSTPGFVRLQAGPCPYMGTTDHGTPRCTVYAVRPYNCRRYGCYQTEPGEPWEGSPVPVKVLRSRDLRRQYAANQRKAQRWAVAHGWSVTT